MSTIKIHTYISQGVDGCPITIEVVKNRSLPCIEIIGLADTAIKEAKERIKASLKVLNISLPPNKIIINLSPSGVKKTGSHLDLPLALGVYMLSTSSRIQGIDTERTLFFGELGLDGSVKGVRYVLPMVLSAMQQGWKKFIIPEKNRNEVTSIAGIEFYTCTHIKDIIQGSLGKVEYKESFLSGKKSIPFQTIQGHDSLKRILCIAALGNHNILLLGSPGSGKTVLAKEMKHISLPLTKKKSLETTVIHFLEGSYPVGSGLIPYPPFIEIHHTVTATALIGGGRPTKPGLISKAHNGILFFDEFFEFSRSILNLLRQPMEDKKVNIGRVHGSIEFPCDFMVVATANPCPCGWYGNSERVCTCSDNQIKRYQKRAQGPLLDRMDIVVEVMSESSSRVLGGESVSKNRMAYMNQGQSIKDKRGEKDVLETFTSQATSLLVEAADSFGLSTRSLLKTSLFARSIADFEGLHEVLPKHVAEALRYRACRLLVA